MKRRLILLGPPASGKGTVAAGLQREFGLPHISSGHLLRREAELGSPVGLRAKLFLEKGDLVPDSIVLEFMSDWMRAASLDAGFMLDGFPRTIAQAKALDEWLDSRKAPIEAVLLFDCSLSVVLDRITGRRSCPKCGRVYHVRSVPPISEGVCDDCGVALTQREDDTEELIRRRFGVYVDQTGPLVEYYDRQGKLHRIEAEAPVEARVAKVAEIVS